MTIHLSGSYVPDDPFDEPEPVANVAALLAGVTGKPTNDAAVVALAARVGRMSTDDVFELGRVLRAKLKPPTEPSTTPVLTPPLIELCGGQLAFEMARHHYAGDVRLDELAEWFASDGLSRSAIARRVKKVWSVLEKYRLLPADWRRRKPGQRRQPKIYTTDKVLYSCRQSGTMRDSG